MPVASVRVPELESQKDRNPARWHRLHPSLPESNPPCHPPVPHVGMDIALAYVVIVVPLVFVVVVVDVMSYSPTSVWACSSTKSLCHSVTCQKVQVWMAVIVTWTFDAPARAVLHEAAPRDLPDCHRWRIAVLALAVSAVRIQVADLHHRHRYRRLKSHR